MPDEYPLFVVKGVLIEQYENDDGETVIEPIEGAPPRYWTGRIQGTWPEYLRDRSRAAAVRKSLALEMAAAFNAQLENFQWSAEPL
jgi:hypothetical protein